MRPTDRLGELIAAHMLAPGDVAEQKLEANFVVSSLRTAIFSNHILRRKILSDVADALGCQAEDLEFLFSDLNKTSPTTQNHDLMVPNFRSQLLAVAQ